MQCSDHFLRGVSFTESLSRALCLQSYSFDCSAYGYPGQYDAADPYAGYYAADYGQPYAAAYRQQLDPYAAAYGQQYDSNAALTAGETAAKP